MTSTDRPMPDSNNELEDYTHHHRTCQNCGRNWWGLHCPHDGYQNPCPECKSVPVVVNAYYCDCEFVIPVPKAEALIKQREQAAVEKYRERLVKSFEANLFDGDKVQAGQMIASTEVKSWLSALEQGESNA